MFFTQANFRQVFSPPLEFLVGIRLAEWLTGLIPSLLCIQPLPRLNLSPMFIVPRTWPYFLSLLGIYGQPLKSHHQNSSLLFSLFQKVLWKHCSQYCLSILFTGCFPEAVFSVCSLTLFAIRFGQWVIVPIIIEILAVHVFHPLPL